jgi:hypothetical protein
MHLKSDGKTGAGQVRFIGQGVDSPRMFRTFVNQSENAGDGRIAQNGRPVRGLRWRRTEPGRELERGGRILTLLQHQGGERISSA